MITFNDELKQYMQLFKETFDDIVPLRQISPAVTNEQLINAIKTSILENKNLLPKIFGYGNSSNDRLY